jgi:hypothetical protein
MPQHVMENENMVSKLSLYLNKRDHMNIKVVRWLVLLTS